MRIVLITPEYPPAPRLGGIATYTATLAPALAARGHDVTVVTRGPQAQRQHDGVGVVRVPTQWLPDQRLERLLLARRTARVVRALRPDVVQTSEWEAPAWWVTRMTDLPVVTRLATPTYLLDELNAGHRREETAFVRRLEQDQTRRSARVFAPSSALAERVAHDWRLERVDVVRTPVDTAAVAAAAASGTRVGPPRALVFVGRLERRKGIDVLGHALPAVLTAHPSLHVVLIGADAGEAGGAVMSELRQNCAPFAERIHEVGELARRDALATVASAALVVLPSLWENVANACLEAMALGRPVVATNVGGFPEFVDHDATGWLVPAGDADALANELTERLAAPTDLARVGAAAAASVSALAPDRIAAELEALYDEVSTTAIDPRVYFRGYRRYFHPEHSDDPFHALYEAKRRAVLGHFEGVKRLRILDLGAGYGRIGGPLSRDHDVTLADISPELLADARAAWPSAKAVELDAREPLPFDDATFDAVVAIDLLPHVRDLSVLAELARVTRQGGDVVFDTTNASPWWVLAYPTYVNWRPKRALLTLIAHGVLPEWRPLVRHHYEKDVRDALQTSRLRLLAMRGFGPRLAPKWHLWLTQRET